MNGGAVASDSVAHERPLMQIAVNSESGMLKTHKLGIGVDSTIEDLLVNLEN